MIRNVDVILFFAYFVKYSLIAKIVFWIPFVSPRRAHDTLRPQDESMIVGYYTSNGSAVPPSVSLINKERR